MESIVTLSVGLGLIVTLAFSEILGITAGGLVVPGYMALYMNEPLIIAATILASLLTYFLVNALGSVTILFGRRRTALMLIIGFAVGSLIRMYSSSFLEPTSIDLHLVGQIVPGLIAIWIDRQGIIESISSMLIASTFVRILLILFLGNVVI